MTFWDRKTVAVISCKIYINNLFYLKLLYTVKNKIRNIYGKKTAAVAARILPQKIW